MDYTRFKHERKMAAARARRQKLICVLLKGVSTLREESIKHGQNIPAHI